MTTKIRVHHHGSDLEVETQDIDEARKLIIDLLDIFDFDEVTKQKFVSNFESKFR